MKYNWSIIGHEKQLKQIEQDFASGNVAHAYLLAGPNSIGKFTVAKKMAGILQCEKDFCHECTTCTQVLKGSHIDTTELKGKDSIKIAEMRKVVEKFSRTGQSKYKILLMQSVERMTIPAANSFLKTLEEPSGNTVFIMTTNNIGDVLPTILPRVRTVKFGNVSLKYLQGKMKELYPDSTEDVLRKVALFSMGKTGKALNLMENPDHLVECVEVYNKVQNFLEYRDVVERFSYVSELVEEERVETFCTMLTHVLRAKILQGDGETMRYIKTLSKIHDSAMLLKKNVNKKLVLENLMLAL